MSFESNPQVLIRPSDSVKLSKPKIPILSPSIESKNFSPNANTKISSRSPNKNYVSVRKFNSSLATTGGNQVAPKVSPKMQLIQQTALSNLPEKKLPVPPSPRSKHRKYESKSQKYESRQIENNFSDIQNSLSKLAIHNTDYASDTYNQAQEELSDNSSIDNSSDSSFFKNTANIRKRKGINCSGSFDLSRKSSLQKISPSFSFNEFQKKVSKTHNNNISILQIEEKTLQEYEEIHSVSSLSLAPHSTEEQMITIQFTSNWGNPKLILLSTVTVMDEKRKSIPIKTISSVPDLPKINLLEKLADHKLVKNEDDVFPIDHDFSIKEKFSLILTIDKSANPKFVRIWNPTLKDEELSSASVKNATVYLNHTKVVEGEVPQNFGVDLEFKDENSEMEEMHQCNSSRLVDELFPSYKVEEKIFDIFGIYPFEKAKIITIEVLSTYKNTGKIDYVGLNGIDIYNDKGIKLGDFDFDSYAIKNILISPCANPRMIIRASMKTCTLENQFLGNYQPDYINEQNQYKTTSPTNPLFIFTLTEPTSLSMMRIWNFNSIDEGLENGIQKIVIRSNNRVIWSGKVKKGSGLMKGFENLATDIWLTDSISIREHVLECLSDGYKIE